MRTDSHHVAPAALDAVRELIKKDFGPGYLPEKPRFYKSRDRAQEAHEAIRPTDVARTPEAMAKLLDPDDARLYELIWNRFVASQMQPALWDVTSIDIRAAAEDVAALFRARGRVLFFDGYTRVAGTRQREGEQQLPELAEGDALDLKELLEKQHFTEPPARYNEATLVKKLESEGIGRPSTYATIITTIQDRGYAKQDPSRFLRCMKHPDCPFTVPCDLEGKPMWPPSEQHGSDACGAALEPKEGKRCFYATDLGEVVTDKLVEHFPKIMDVAFTSHMEEELDEVEEAKIAWLDVVREFWGPFSEALERAGADMKATKHEAVEEAGPCPDCGAPLVKRFSKRGPFLGCSKYPDCKYTRPMNGEARPQPKPTEHKCEKCGGTMLLRYNQRGEPFLGCENYPKCKSTLPADAEGNPIKPQVTDVVCDKCQSPMLIKTSKRGPFFACSAYPKCRFTLPCGDDGKPVRPVPTGEVCEKCGSPMVIKNSRRGPFLACSGYPKCRNAKSLKKAGLATEKEGTGNGEQGTGTEAKPKKRRAAAPRKPKATPTDRMCPDCGAPLLIRSGRRGPFLGCSKYPDCRHTEDLPADLKPKPE
jgi:DNA topoisomerase-1